MLGRLKKLLSILFTNKIFSFFVDLLSTSRWEYKYKTYRSEYDIHKNFVFNGPGILIYGYGLFSAGENSYIGRYSTIQLTKGFKVSIGKNVSISHNIKIYTSNRNADDIINENSIINSKAGDVYIGDNSWIGANVFIREGVKIGKNCFIGANSVVTKDIKYNCIAVGTPAKIIKCKT